MSKVDEAIIEIDQALADMAAPHEGLHDFQRLNITEETHAAVSAAIEQYNRRKQRLESARGRLQQLVEDGHPVLEIEAVTLSVKADLDEQNRTIDAALAKFSTNAASNLGLSSATPEPK